MSEEHAIDIRDALSVLDVDRQRRVDEFKRIIESEGKRLHVSLVGIPQITQDGRIVVIIQAIAQ